MAKKAAAASAPAPKAEDTFVDLMLLAADYAKASGGIEAARKSLVDTAAFIDKAGSAEKAGKALDVLESLKERI